jgi:ParB-like chromosome segregation protein Spo0J
MKIELKKLSELTLLETNPRLITQDKFQKLKVSIQKDKEFLNSRPILCYPENDKLIIYAGNQRYRACNELKMLEVPVIVDYEANPETIKNRILLDNIEYGDWDLDILGNNWDLDELEEFEGLDSNLDFKLKDLRGEREEMEIDFDNIKSNEDRERKFKDQLITCPHCEGKFNIQV